MGFFNNRFECIFHSNALLKSLNFRKIVLYFWLKNFHTKGILYFGYDNEHYCNFIYYFYFRQCRTIQNMIFHLNDI
jgi:hypothetical protein